MAYRSENYKPHKRSREILTRAWGHVQSVPYQVTARWLFYRLLQDGYYKTKSDYDNKFLPLLSRARHCFYESWRPDTLADDRRAPIVRGDGYESPAAWVEMLASRARCNLARWEGQSYYVEVWFEAEAMKSQFGCGHMDSAGDGAGTVTRAAVCLPRDGRAGERQRRSGRH